MRTHHIAECGGRAARAAGGLKTPQTDGQFACGGRGAAVGGFRRSCGCTGRCTPQCSVWHWKTRGRQRRSRHRAPHRPATNTCTRQTARLHFRGAVCRPHTVRCSKTGANGRIWTYTMVQRRKSAAAIRTCAARGHVHSEGGGEARPAQARWVPNSSKHILFSVLTRASPEQEN